MQKKRVAIYIRVSTDDQVNNGNWLDVQLSSLQSYIKAKEDVGYYTNDNLVYKDEWFSWWLAVEDRPGLNRMLNDIKMGKIDIVLVKKIDRLARRTTVLLDIVQNQFKRHWIEFICLDQNIDTTTPMWTFFLTLLWAFAEMERELISERTTGWKRWAIINKKSFPYGNAPFWYIKDANTKHLVINFEEANLIKKTFDLYVNHKKTIPNIVEELNKNWYSELFKNKKNPENKGKIDEQLLYKILRNEAYINKYYLCKYKNIRDIINKTRSKILLPESEWLKYELPMIVEEKIFDEAQKLLDVNKKKLNNVGKKVLNHIFSGVVVCWECNSTYQTYRKKKWDKYFNYCFCTKKSTKYWDSKCDNWQVSEEDLKVTIFKEINKVIANPEVYLSDLINENSNKNLIETLYNDISNLLLKKEKLIKELEKTINLILGEDNEISIKIYNEKKEKTQENINNIKGLISEKESQIKKMEWEEINKQEVVEFYKKLKNINIEEISIEEQKEIIDVLVAKILIYKNKIVVWLKYINDYIEDKPAIDSLKKNFKNSLVNSSDLVSALSGSTK